MAIFITVFLLVLTATLYLFCSFLFLVIVESMQSKKLFFSGFLEKILCHYLPFGILAIVTVILVNPERGISPFVATLSIFFFVIIFLIVWKEINTFVGKLVSINSKKSTSKYIFESIFGLIISTLLFSNVLEVIFLEGVSLIPDGLSAMLAFVFDLFLLVFTIIRIKNHDQPNNLKI